MMFGPQPRSLLIIVGSIVFLTALISLAYNHVDILTVKKAPPPPKKRPNRVSSHYHPIEGPLDMESPPDVPPQIGNDESIRDFFINHVQKPVLNVDAPFFALWGAFKWDLPSEPRWKKNLGEDFCIIDLDNRPFSEPNQVFGPNVMSWDDPIHVHGLSLGVLNHWLYSKIHGYKYYYIEVEAYEDRRASWKKAQIITKILKQHQACVFLDSDAVFHHLNLPFEWLMNYWELHPDTTSLALSLDPNSDNNMDKFGKVYLNTGFIIAQNNQKTFEILDAWDKCPNDDSKHPDCAEFRLNKPGKPTDQGGFGTFIRYDFPEDIKELPCIEANGFPESNSGCHGLFIKHLWTGKDTWIKLEIGQQIPGALLETLHREFKAEMGEFYMTEAKLMAGSDP